MIKYKMLYVDKYLALLIPAAKPKMLGLDKCLLLPIQAEETPVTLQEPEHQLHIYTFESQKRFILYTLNIGVY